MAEIMIFVLSVLWLARWAKNSRPMGDKRVQKRQKTAKKCGKSYNFRISVANGAIQAHRIGERLRNAQGRFV